MINDKMHKTIEENSMYIHQVAQNVNSLPITLYQEVIFSRDVLHEIVHEYLPKYI
jgi:hypothetical protein